METHKNLGKLRSVYGLAPLILQRAAFVAALSFIFFLATLLVFYYRQNIVYFLLSTAFLIVYVLTMLGWFMLRKNVLKIYENGLTYKNFASRWDELEAVETNKTSDKVICEIRKKNGEKTILTETIRDIERAIGQIKTEISKEAIGG